MTDCFRLCSSEHVACVCDPTNGGDRNALLIVIEILMQDVLAREQQIAQTKSSLNALCRKVGIPEKYPKENDNAQAE